MLSDVKNISDIFNELKDSNNLMQIELKLS